MNTRSDILAALRTLLPGLQQSLGVRSLALFGSTARGDVHPDSDIDILVTFDPQARVTLFTLARLQTILEAALSHPVDIVEDHPRLHPDFRKHIQRDLVRVT